jgi:hypothetical protein
MTATRRIIAIAVVLFVGGCGSAPNASNEATSACAATGRPYTGDQPPPGYPDARRGTGSHSNEWYVPAKSGKGKWGILCMAQ